MTTIGGIMSTIADGVSTPGDSAIPVVGERLGLRSGHHVHQW